MFYMIVDQIALGDALTTTEPSTGIFYQFYSFSVRLE